MGRLVHIFALLLLAFSAACAGCTALPPVEMQPPAVRQPLARDLALDAVVALTVADGRITCSGWVAGSRVVTAAHCVQGRRESGQPVFVGRRQSYDMATGGFTRLVTYHVLADDPVADWAILVPATPTGPIPSLRTSQELWYGQRVVIVGHPALRWGGRGGVGWSVSPGYIMAPDERVDSVDGQHYLQVYSHPGRGASGAPLVAEDGSVLGMYVWMSGNGSWGGAVPARVIQEALDAN